VVLAIDGLQPDVGHEVLWVVRECLSAEVLVARTLLSSTEESLTGFLLREVEGELEVPVLGVVSDGQHPIRRAMARVFAEAPHQLCQFHYLREAAKEGGLRSRPPRQEGAQKAPQRREAYRAGVLEGREDPQAEAIRGYCLALRSAITDDGRGLHFRPRA
jgi:hypothetical protein